MVRNNKTTPSRRKVIQGITAASLGTLYSTGVAQAATGETYEVHVWQTADLEGYCQYTLGVEGSRAMDNAKMILQEAMNRINNDINVILHSDTVSCPEENAYTEFDATYPCSTFTGHYNHNLDWWEDYHSCKDLISARDTNLLLTSTDSVRGGRSFRGGPYTVVQTGQHLAEADTYVNHAKRSNDTQNGVEGLLHEVGHAFQMTDSEADSAHNNPNYGTHETGDDFSHTYGTAITPLGHGAENSTNECDDPVGSLDGFEQTWAGCTQDYWADSG